MNLRWVSSDTVVKNPGNVEWFSMSERARLAHDELERFCGKTFNGGRIKRGAQFKTSDWRRIALCSRRTIDRLVEGGWCRWDGDDLIVLHYDVYGEELARRRSDHGRHMNDVRWQRQQEKAAGNSKNDRVQDRFRNELPPKTESKNESIAPRQVAESRHFGHPAGYPEGHPGGTPSGSPARAHAVSAGAPSGSGSASPSSALRTTQPPVRPSVSRGESAAGAETDGRRASRREEWRILNRQIKRLPWCDRFLRAVGVRSAWPQAKYVVNVWTENNLESHGRRVDEVLQAAKVAGKMPSRDRPSRWLVHRIPVFMTTGKSKGPKKSKATPAPAEIKAPAEWVPGAAKQRDARGVRIDGDPMNPAAEVLGTIAGKVGRS